MRRCSICKFIERIESIKGIDNWTSDILYERLCPECNEYFSVCYDCLLKIGGAIDNYGLQCIVCKRDNKIKELLNK